MTCHAKAHLSFELTSFDWVSRVGKTIKTRKLYEGIGNLSQKNKLDQNEPKHIMKPTVEPRTTKKETTPEITWRKMLTCSSTQNHAVLGLLLRSKPACSASQPILTAKPYKAMDLEPP